MPWKFLLFLIGLALVIIFAGLNISHSTDISFGFHTFEDVPVFLGLGSAYLLGALTMLPFALSKALKKRRELSTKYKEEKKKSIANSPGEKKPSRFGRSKKKALPHNEESDGSPDTQSTDGSTPVPSRPN